MRLVESPRDAFQAFEANIPTQKKVDYINSLLKVGFNTLDVGSFVSPKAIPQLADTAKVMDLINYEESDSLLLTIIPNVKGAQLASQFSQISFLGYPFSISPTFLQKNINSDIEKSFNQIHDILDVCDQHSKILVVYISMAFGNPYGDDWSLDMLEDWMYKLQEIGICMIPLADTVGYADPERIAKVFERTRPFGKDVEIGLHLHTTPSLIYDKIDAAWNNGCRRYETVLGGYGGCPMSGMEMQGNLNTLELIDYFDKNKIKYDLDKEALKAAQLQSAFLFTNPEKP